MSRRAITRRNGGPFSRINWDSPAAVNELSANRPAVKTDTGTVILFGCGCASWLTYNDGHSGADPDAEVVRLRESGGRWAGATTARYRRDGRSRTFTDGSPMPSWLDCTHGGAA